MDSFASQKVPLSLRFSRCLRFFPRDSDCSGCYRFVYVCVCVCEFRKSPKTALSASVFGAVAHFAFAHSVCVCIVNLFCPQSCFVHSQWLCLYISVFCVPCGGLCACFQSFPSPHLSLSAVCCLQNLPLARTFLYFTYSGFYFQFAVSGRA
eukprot:Opistho-2@21883